MKNKYAHAVLILHSCTQTAFYYNYNFSFLFNLFHFILITKIFISH